MKEIKLQKYLQDCGLASRREIRGWIHDGKIKVNQRTVPTQFPGLPPATGSICATSC